MFCFGSAAQRRRWKWKRSRGEVKEMRYSMHTAIELGRKIIDRIKSVNRIRFPITNLWRADSNRFHQLLIAISLAWLAFSARPEYRWFHELLGAGGVFLSAFTDWTYEQFVRLMLLDTRPDVGPLCSCIHLRWAGAGLVGDILIPDGRRLSQKAQ